jgi:hypothetical protein
MSQLIAYTIIIILEELKALNNFGGYAVLAE